MGHLGVTSEGGLVNVLLQLLRSDSGSSQQSDGWHPSVIPWTSLARPQSSVWATVAADHTCREYGWCSKLEIHFVLAQEHVLLLSLNKPKAFSAVMRVTLFKLQRSCPMPVAALATPV